MGVNAGLAALLRWSLVAVITVMLGCVGLQVFMRYVLGSPPSWAEELAVLMFSWLAMGSLALGVREKFHVRTGLNKLLPEYLRTHYERGISVLTVAFGFYLLWSGWRFVAFTAGGKSAAIRYPLEYLHLMAPVAGALVAIFALESTLKRPEYGESSQ